MNVLRGEIISIEVKNRLSLVRVRAGQANLSTIVIDTPDTASYLQTGNAINVVFKETEVIIGKGTQHDISLQNKLTGSVKAIESGDLLSKLTLDTEVGKVVSIITTNAVNQLKLKQGSEITAMIKTNEIMLSE